LLHSRHRRDRCCGACGKRFARRCPAARRESRTGFPSSESTAPWSSTSPASSITTLCYPATTRLIRALGRDAAAHLHSKATLRFSLTEDVPTRLIARIAKTRAGEVAGLAQARSAAPRKPTRRKKKRTRS